MLVSLGIAGMGMFGLGAVQRQSAEILGGIDFNKALLHGMLSFLLFAGALHIKLEDLSGQKWVVALLATAGVMASMFLVGGLSWLLLKALGIPIPFIHCLLFGALISPTDPVAVLGILKTAGIPKSLEIKIAGESLFNDGIGVVVFLILLELSGGGVDVTVRKAFSLFLTETVGGAALGLLFGFLAYRMLKGVNNYQVEVIITLALVMGGYTLADRLHTSGPIAIVVAGLLIGNRGRAFAMSDLTREHLDAFWELVDGILTAVLFLLIGLEIQVIPFRHRRDRGDRGHPAGPVDQRRYDGWRAAAVPALQPRNGPDPDLGRTARRYFGGAGALPARRPPAGRHPGHDLHHGGVLDHRPGAVAGKGREAGGKGHMDHGRSHKSSIP
jgi:CPA1 family monovalent cation:H+ antiporter